MILSHAAHMRETTLHIVWAVYPVRMQAVEGGTSKSRQGSQNWLNPFIQDNREDDHLAAGIVEEQIAPIKAMVAYIRHIVNNSEPVALIRSNRSVTNFVCPP